MIKGAISAESIPVFERNFDRFLGFLKVDANPASISPKRFSLVLSLGLQTLAAKAHVHRNTISRAPADESAQVYLRGSVRVMRAAADIAGSVEKAISGSRTIRCHRSTTRRRKTLSLKGRSGNLKRYVQSLQAGFGG